MKDVIRAHDLHFTIKRREGHNKFRFWTLEKVIAKKNLLRGEITRFHIKNSAKH